MRNDAHPPRFVCLVIEDSDCDYERFKRSLNAINVPMTLKRCAVGDEAMTMLAHLERPSVGINDVPAVIVLDLHLRGQYGGREILRAVRKHPRIKRTPVVIFSSSTDPVDIDWCDREGASAYHVKGFDPSSFRCAAESVAKFWMSNEPICKERPQAMEAAIC